MTPPKADVHLELDITMDTEVTVTDFTAWEACDEYDHADCDHPVTRTLTLGELIAEKLIERAAGTQLSEAAIRARLDEITDEEIRNHARFMIRQALAVDPSELSPKQTTLGARICQVIQQQLSGQPTTYARGKDATVVDAIIATEVTNQFRDLGEQVVAQVRERVLADIRQAGIRRHPGAHTL